MSVICPACHGHNRDSARCCTTCGAELTIACPQCQARNKPAARFCAQCGHSLVAQILSSQQAPEPVYAGKHDQTRSRFTLGSNTLCCPSR